MPNPCAHCALAAKPAQVPEPALTLAIPALSTAALRAKRYRERQEQNPNFKKKEATRKQQERKEKKEQDAEKWSARHPGFPLNFKALRRMDGPSNDERAPLFMKGAPRGKARLIRYGGSTELEKASGGRTADAAMSELPLRAQLSDGELRTRLKSLGDLQSKIDLILAHWRHDEEFCEWLNQLSLDEVTKFIQYCSENLETARMLLYERTEHQAGALVAMSADGPSMPQAQSQLTHALPHGRRVEPSGISDNHEADLGRETDRTFAKRISFKKRDVQVIRIGKRNARFYNLQNGEVEEHFTEFVQNNSRGDKGRMCKLCGQRFEDGFDHFGTEHRENVVQYIRWYEAKAWRPKSRRRCDQDHDALAKKCSGAVKVYCRKCGKLVYKPAKPGDVSKRSDAPEMPIINEAMLVTAVESIV